MQFGIVMKLRRKKDGKLFADKIIKHYTKYLESEIQFLDKCDHVNIVKFFEIYNIIDFFVCFCLFFAYFFKKY